MGYYSEVGLALTHNGVKHLDGQLSLTDASGKVTKQVAALLNFADRHYTDKATKAEVWWWKNLKWYADDPEYFPEISFMEKVMAELDDSEYRFIRIGENYDDTEARGGFTENPFDLELARGMTIQAI